MENFPTNQEIWMSVNGYINYEVSSFGRIRNAKTGKMLKPTITKGYYRVGLTNDQGKKFLQVHRLVAFAFLDTIENFDCVDHIDRNPVNNHISNLRFATYKQNSQNRRKLLGTSSKYTGVHKDSRTGKWRAEIRDNGRKVNIGTFTDEEDAGRAYDKKAIEIHGPHARINFPLAMNNK